MTRSLLLVALATLAASPSLAQSFDVLDFSAYGVSADGSVIVGTQNGTAVRWTADGGTVSLGALPGSSGFDIANATSADGSVVVGRSRNQAFRWTATGGMVGLGTLGGPDPESSANDVSDDGTVIVGTSLSRPPNELIQEAFRWTGGVMTGLGDLAGGESQSQGSGVSADGSVTVGVGNRATSNGSRAQAVRWQGTGSPQGLAFLPGGDNGLGISNARAASADGTLIVGTGISNGPQGLSYQATLWNGTSPQGLGWLPGSPFLSVATSLSADGSVVVGYTDAGAFLWTADAGMRSLEDILVNDYGLDLQGVSVTDALDISADGTVVVGIGNNGTSQVGWRAVLVEQEGFVVNETTDESDADLEDGMCDTDLDAPDLQCTLRAALEQANAQEGADAITFDLDGTGPFVIAPESPLPAITDAVTLDGASQPGTADVPLVRLDGAAAGAGTDGLRVEADGVTIRGLMVTSFTQHGVHIADGLNGILEALIVGSDALGTDGLGNGGDGIHVSGGSGLRIGPTEEELARPTSAINLGVISVSNLLNGLYVRDDENAALIRALRSGAVSRIETRAINLNVNGLTAGLVETLSGPVARPNGQNGVCLLGADGATFRNLTVSDALRHALEINASRNVTLLSGLFGLRRPVPTAPGQIGSIGQSAIRMMQSLNVTVGSADPEAAPVQGGGSGGWFMEVEESQEVQIRNLLAGLFQSTAPPSSPLLAALRNRAGGLGIFDSPDVRVGLQGLATVFANSGGDTNQPQAGLFATGRQTTGLRVLNTFLGTTPQGFRGIGNLGSGMMLADGLSGAVVGGDAEADQVVSGGNMGYGFLFQDLTPEKAGLDANASAINLVSGTRLISGLLGGPLGETISVPNLLSGFCLNRIQGGLFEKLSAGSNGRHGLEILQSQDVDVISAQIGSLFERLLQSPEDVMGPDGDGVHIANSQRVGLGRPFAAGNPFERNRNLFVHGAGGRGLHFQSVDLLRALGLGVGTAPPGSVLTPEMATALGNAFEGIGVENSANVLLENADVMGNGAMATSGAGGLFGSLTQNLRLIGARFGDLAPNGQPQRANAGLAVIAQQMDSLQVAMSQIVGHLGGVQAENTTWSVEQTTFEQQGATGGVGDAIRQIGGRLEGIFNTFKANAGAAVRTSDDASGIVRFSDIEGNGEGVTVDGDGLAASGVSFIATENWWGAADGPGGEGPGSGDTVSDGVDISDWLTAPRGVLVAPEADVVEFGGFEPIEVLVRYASPLLGEDQLDVTITDERGWASDAFTVAVPAGGFTERTFTVEPTLYATSAVIIRAVSQTDATLEAEATVVVMPEGTATPLTASVPAGFTVLPADGEGVFQVGGEVVINPGKATMETGVVTGFGSILLADPLRFAHEPGEVVIPANAAAVAGEPPPGLPEAGGHAVLVYPNPTRGSASVMLSAPSPGAVRVTVHDALGREVAVLHEGPAVPRDLALPRLAPGVYVVRAVSPDGNASTAVTVVR